MLKTHLRHNSIYPYIVTLAIICLIAFAFGFINNRFSHQQAELVRGETVSEVEAELVQGEATSEEEEKYEHGPGIHANSEKSVSDLTSISDVIVRIVVEEQTPRTLVADLPAYGVAGADPNTPLEELENAEAVQVGTKRISTTYTDSKVTVLEVYKGSTADAITVMQLGNNLDGILNTALLTIGDEYVLFLKDISGDHIHAPDRELYRTINPWGIYTIIGEQVNVHGELINGDVINNNISFPVTLEGLESEITQ